jgi:hypothetical protein
MSLLVAETVPRTRSLAVPGFGVRAAHVPVRDAVFTTSARSPFTASGRQMRVSAIVSRSVGSASSAN